MEPEGQPYPPQLQPGPSSLPPPPPPPQASAEPQVNIAMVAKGGFSPGSPLHTWITGPPYQASDPTETRIVNVIRDVLMDQSSTSNYTWHPSRTDNSFIRVDLSFWVGMPNAPYNWRLDLPDGWTRASYVLEHIGDPRICNNCDCQHRREDAEARLEDAEARLEKAETKLKNTNAELEVLRAQIQGQEQEERPRKKPRLHEPTTPWLETPTLRGTGSSSRRRGGRGIRGSRTTNRGGRAWTASPRMEMIPEDVSSELAHHGIPHPGPAYTSYLYPEMPVPDYRTALLAEGMETGLAPAPGVDSISNPYLHSTGILDTVAPAPENQPLLPNECMESMSGTALGDSDVLNFDLASADLINLATPALQNEPLLRSEGVDSTPSAAHGHRKSSFDINDYVQALSGDDGSPSRVL